MESKKIIYLANVRLPTERAHGIQIVKTCEALAAGGAMVELVAPNRLNNLTEDIFAYYGAKHNFVISKIPCWDLITRAPWLGPLAYWVEAVSFALSARKFNNQKDAIFYTRELSNIIFISRKRKIIYEAHNYPKNHGLIFKYLLKKLTKLVVISQGLKTEFLKHNIPEQNILVAHDGVDLEFFKTNVDASLLRRSLNIPGDKKVVLYAGHLYEWKGAGTLLECAKLLPQYYFVFVGGTKIDLNNFTKQVNRLNVKNVMLVGKQPFPAMPKYLNIADILVLPNSAKTPISAQYTSPLKLFEYMAAKRPIIASDLPSLKEILITETATFFKADDPSSLAKAIIGVFQNYNIALAKAERAYAKVQNYTWQKRVERILEFIIN